MKKKESFLQNLILTLVLVGGILGVYLYAGSQERAAAELPAHTAESADLLPESKQTEASASAPEVSADGRRKDAVLQTFSDAGYVLNVRSEGSYFLLNEKGETVAQADLSLQGERVSGLVLRVPLPKRATTGKNPTLIEKRLLEDYEKQCSEAKTLVSDLLNTALASVDPYQSVPITARTYWHTLLAQAMEEEKEVSDAGEAIRFRIYFSNTDEKTHLFLSLQQK